MKTMRINQFLKSNSIFRLIADKGWVAKVKLDSSLCFELFIEKDLEKKLEIKNKLSYNFLRDIISKGGELFYLRD